MSCCALRSRRVQVLFCFRGRNSFLCYRKSTYFAWLQGDIYNIIYDKYAILFHKEHHANVFVITSVCVTEFKACERNTFVALLVFRVCIFLFVNIVVVVRVSLSTALALKSRRTTELKFSNKGNVLVHSLVQSMIFGRKDPMWTSYVLGLYFFRLHRRQFYVTYIFRLK